MPQGATPPPPPPKADPAASKVLADAIQNLDPKKLGWVGTTLWQQADLQGFTFEATGKYLSAPDQRLHLDLQVRLGDTTGRLDVISDGTTLWQRMRVGNFPARASKMDLKPVLEQLKSSADLAPLQQEFLQTQSFLGIMPLLQSIQQRMTVTRQDRVRVGGQDMTRLTAEWTEPQTTPYVPRRCEMFLAPAGTGGPLWPYRLEWRGPAPSRGDDALLFVMEFRDPKLNEPLAAAEADKLFKFQPGTTEVQDQTKEVTEMYKMRAQQIAAAKAAPAAPPAGQASKPDSTQPEGAKADTGREAK